MGRKKKKHSRKFSLPLGVVIPLVASVVTGAKSGWDSPLNHGSRGDWAGALRNLSVGWFFWDTYEQRFDSGGGNYLKSMVVGGLVHWIAGKIGINRWLGRARVPLIRI